MPERREWYLLLLCWFIYLFHLGPIPGVNENRYLDLLHAIVEDHSFTIDSYHYNTTDKAYYNGHYYAHALPGPVLVSLPAYFLFKQIFTLMPPTLMSQFDQESYIRTTVGQAQAPDAFVEQYPFFRFLLAHLVVTGMTCSLLASMLTILLYRLLVHITQNYRYAFFLAVTYAFGTITFFYATRLYSHVFSTFFVFSAFVWLFMIRHKWIQGRRHLFGAGLCTGGALLMDYNVIPIVACIGLYALMVIDRKKIPVYISGGTIPIIILLVYQYICFDSPFSTPYSFPLTETSDEVPWQSKGIYGFNLPSFTSLWGLSFSLYRGLFAYMPILLPAVPALILGLYKRQTYRLEWLVIAGACTSQFLFNASMDPFWHAGYVFGPRFLMPLIPFLIIPLGLIEHRGIQQGVMVLGVISILVNWAGVQYIVSQNAVGSLAIFLLSGPTTQLYEFLQDYFHNHAQWQIPIESFGGFLLLGILLTLLWKWIAPRNISSEQT